MPCDNVIDAFYPEQIESKPRTVKVHIETEWIDWRKHGRGYVRRMKYNTFVDPTHVEWGKKIMKMYFDFEVVPGELLQVRLSDGSWKNDSKHYVRVSASGSLVDVPQDEAGKEIAASKAIISKKS